METTNTSTAPTEELIPVELRADGHYVAVRDRAGRVRFGLLDDGATFYSATDGCNDGQHPATLAELTDRPLHTCREFWPEGDEPIDTLCLHLTDGPDHQEWICLFGANTIAELAQLVE